MRILILGGAGVLGSLLSYALTEKQFYVDVVDIVRPYEAWRLHENKKSTVKHDDDNRYYVYLRNGEFVRYIWSYAEYAKVSEYDYDVVIDAAVGSADRPMGSYSPKSVALANLSVPLSIYEKYSGNIIIYPSSFNSMYGHKQISQDKLPDPSNLYGWTKASSELLYRALAREKNGRVIITRLGSVFGPKGRSDELPHRLIIDMLNNKDKIELRCPDAHRLWTYAKDVASFYVKLLEELDVRKGEVKVYHVAGNKDPGILDNLHLLKIIASITGWSGEVISSICDPGEVFGVDKEEPINFEYETDLKPAYTLKEGLEETVEWFKNHRKFYAME